MWNGAIQDIQSNLSGFASALWFAPRWAVSLILLLGAAIAALIVHAAIYAVLRRLSQSRQPYLRTILDATRKPARFALVLVALAITIPIAPLGQTVKFVLLRCLAVAVICVVGWIALTVLHLCADIYLLKFRVDTTDNLLARKHTTQVRVLVGVLDTIIVLVTVGFALMSFQAVRQYGVSLFASAGVAGIIAGLAARPVLSNLFAGVQLAMTQPIRLEDAVTVENEYGWIEEITSAYVVIRLWDLRRLIVPLSYFIEKPFYNWTRQPTANMGYVLLYLDYTAPIDRIRQKAAEFVAQSKGPAGKVVNVQVTNCTAEAIEVRVLLTAGNPARASDLCAELREKLIGFLQREHPDALPRRRNEIVAPSMGKDGAPHVQPPAGGA